MAERDSRSPAAPEGPSHAYVRLREALLRALQTRLETRAQHAANLYRLGMDAAEAGRDVDAQGLFTRAKRSADELLRAARVHGRDRFPLLGVEAALIAGRSALQGVTSDALRAKLKAAGSTSGGDIATAVAAGRGPSPRISPATRRAQDTIRRALGR
ncbi:hypothetical protein BJF83_06925 [Nocardiopsis sp. CNR-923]|uniref:hypothetical protein n=1 Tax=Nocardiopsis sp. CNR-923 TaxID=1904965 RepID=UPI00095F363B|nr:hypothetical protein [Nocardiopsis sp. CNR-923]OLT24211.1 hypothetical protein BJF83_06925 [Nocardiopsis sp. CNR-923]